MCEDCKECMEIHKSKCCTCHYMIVSEWDGWLRYCAMFDYLCSDIEDICDRYKEAKKEGDK